LLKEILLDETAVQESFVARGANNEPEVRVKLTTLGTGRLTDITETNIGQRLAVIFDSRILSTPVIRARIATGLLTIASEKRMTEAAAFALADRLNAARPGLDKGSSPDEREGGETKEGLPKESARGEGPGNGRQAAQVRVRQAREDFLRVSNLFYDKFPRVSESQFMQSRNAKETAEAEAQGDAIGAALVRLKEASAEFLRTSNLFHAMPPLASETEFLQARRAKELAEAVVRGDPKEVARVRWRHANENFLRVSNLFHAKPPIASEQDFIRAKNAKEMLEAEWRDAGGQMRDIEGRPGER
jgi:hypothetical protein